MSTEKFKYFFSYTRKDSEFVLRLAKELRAVGVYLWLDQLDVLGGQHWDHAVEKALKSCKGMIAALSPEGVASDNMMDEVTYALNEKKLVVPVLVRSCDIPLRLQRVQYIDFTADYDTGFSQLLRALRIEQSAKPLESAATQEPVVQDSTAPLQEKSTKPVVHEKQTAQEIEEPLLSKVSEPIPDALDHPKPTGVETQKAGSKNQTAKVLAAICIVALIAIISIGVFLKYRQPKIYSLTATAIDGTVTKRPDQARYSHDETVTLEAVPNKAYRFTNWSGDLSSSINPTTLVMDADKSVTASFALLKAGDVVTNSIGMKLVYIPAGSFMMGSSDSAAQLTREYGTKEEYLTDEFPQHQVRISEGFWMGQTEVTQSQYESVMNAQPWSEEAFVQGDANNPAVCMSWDDAVEFCRKLSQQEGKTYKLPTEAEWEYACRAGTTTRFSFGDSGSSLGDYVWFGGNADKVGQKYAHSVGQKKPNPWGLYDMNGNVWEWCCDWYDEDYYSNSPSVDPDGPSYGGSHSLRGGSWSDKEGGQRCSVRLSHNPGIHRSLVGFRVVRSQP